MTLVEAYADAHWPGPVRVFGCALRPITLAHVLLLQVARSPFPLAEGATAGLGDALIATWILSRSWRAAAVRLWSRSMRWWLAWRAVLWRLNKADLASRVELLDRVIGRACSLPPFWADAESRESTAPPLLALKLELMARGKTEAEALDTLMAVAAWECTGWAERGGRVNFVTETDAECMSRLASRRNQGN